MGSGAGSPRPLPSGPQPPAVPGKTLWPGVRVLPVSLALGWDLSCLSWVEALKPGAAAASGAGRFLGGPVFCTRSRTALVNA